jgi:hypothetical protein
MGVELLALRPAVVRGNASEILALADRSVAAASNFKVPSLLLPFLCSFFSSVSNPIRIRERWGVNQLK